jgi:hypothetical protein
LLPVLAGWLLCLTSRNAKSRRRRLTPASAEARPSSPPKRGPDGQTTSGRDSQEATSLHETPRLCQPSISTARPRNPGPICLKHVVTVGR